MALQIRIIREKPGIRTVREAQRIRTIREKQKIRTTREAVNWIFIIWKTASIP